MSYASYLVCLRSLGSLDDVEFDFIAFFEALIAFALDGCVVNEYVGALIATEETVPFSVVEPLDSSFQSFHAGPSFCTSHGAKGRARDIGCILGC